MFKLELEYKIGNRKVSQKEWLDHLEKRAKEEVVAGALKRMKTVRCPVHGKSPEVTYSNGKFQIKACCKQAIEAANRALSG